MRISDWSSDVCSSDLIAALDPAALALAGAEDMELAVGGLARDQRADLPRPDIERRDDLFDARRRHRSNPRSTGWRSEEHTSELQSLMRISSAVFCLKKKNNPRITTD